jgi:hypothetical protein
MAISYNITNYSDTFTNIVLIDNLTPDILKRKYSWIFSATVKDAIIGQNDRGLIWYTGDWYSGDWEDGTWYSGNWYDGIWKNGIWNSWRLDRRQLLQHNVRVIEKDNPKYSQFLGGIWRNGIFNNGYFGPSADKDWDAGDGDYFSAVQYEPRWENGTFHKGVFRNSTWLDGMWLDGYFYNSQWITGTFIKGIFDGHTWWNGNFSGGDFIKGVWKDGTFTQISKIIKSRFGSGIETTTDIVCYWIDGIFNGGEMHSGLNVVSGYTTISNNHNRTHWSGGTFNNGKWYGGTYEDGVFNNGYWYEGVWENGIFNNGQWYNGLWLDGIFNDGYFRNGIWQKGTFNGGFMGYEKYKIAIKEKEILVRKINQPSIK